MASNIRPQAGASGKKKIKQPPKSKAALILATTKVPCNCLFVYLFLNVVMVLIGGWFSGLLIRKASENMQRLGGGFQTETANFFSGYSEKTHCTSREPSLELAVNAINRGDRGLEMSSNSLQNRKNSLQFLFIGGL
jgi:hypothetical protein